MDIVCFKYLFGHFRGGDDDGRNGAEPEEHQGAVDFGEVEEGNVRLFAELVQVAYERELGRAWRQFFHRLFWPNEEEKRREEQKKQGYDNDECHSSTIDCTRICESHAHEISKLGYCSNHRKLVESQHMCEGCSSSSQQSKHGVFRKITFMIREEDGDDDEKRTKMGMNSEFNAKCSRCDVSLEMESKYDYSSYLLIKPNWEVLDYTQKANLITEAGITDDEIRDGAVSEQSRSDFAADHREDGQRILENPDVNEMLLGVVDGGFGRREGEDEGDSSASASGSDGKEDDDEAGILVIEKGKEPFTDDDLIHVFMDDPCSDYTNQVSGEDVCLEILTQHLEYYIDSDDMRLIPVGLVEKGNGICDHHQNEEGDIEIVLDGKCISGEPQISVLEPIESTTNPSPSIVISEGGDLIMEMLKDVIVPQPIQHTTVRDGDDGAHRRAAVDSGDINLSVDGWDARDATELGSVRLNGGGTEAGVATENELIIGFSDNGAEAREAAENGSVNLNHGGGEAREATENGVISFDDNGGEAREAAENGDVSINGDDDGQEPATAAACRDISLYDDNAEARASATDGNQDVNLNDRLEELETPDNETETRAWMGIEAVADRELIPEFRNRIELASDTCALENPSTSSFGLYKDDGNVDGTFNEQFEEETAEPNSIDQPLNNDMHVSPDDEEEKMPGSPNSADHLDDGTFSDFEANEGVLTVESLKSVLKAERKNLNALYVELEEERSASAIAANQTMAMINRLQEEKAAMQMEALQYQRMMEEQSEYDQEALQLLNELMVKREREKQELERELEVYRRRVMDYETREKMMMLKRVRDGSIRSRTSTASCSNAEDSDGLSIDLNQEGKEEEDNHLENGNHNTPIDSVLNLDESLANFEDERLLILDQLRILEEKLFSLADDEEEHFEDMKPFEQFYEENRKEFEEQLDSSCGTNDVVSNGVVEEVNGKHLPESRLMGSKGKRLLPLFDALSVESEDGAVNGHENDFSSYSSQPFQVSKFELETKKLAIEEEVDHLYDRLHALEADREFLKHCVGSLKKGGKGMDLLKEILQHLRDLRNVELRAKNAGDSPLS